jgi:uncharacterized membrane protein
VCVFSWWRIRINLLIFSGGLFKTICVAVLVICSAMLFVFEKRKIGFKIKIRRL